MKDYKKYSPISFWSWNDKLEPEILKKQIQWMSEHGIGGFFMHARSGLATDYLSEEWMECIEACAKEAERLNMQAWIYDENGWPSGFVGGKLLEEENNRDQYITYKIGTYDSTATVNYLLEGDNLRRVVEGDSDGEYLNLYIKIATSTADILNPDVVDRFIELTHEAYQKRFGQQFSEKIDGFFTDEPQYHRWATPYTKMIQEYFEEQYGEDILDSLGLLFVEKEGYRSFRYRYWKGMQTLMLRNFAERVYSWCDEHGVKLTGHYIEETTLGYQNMCCAGTMPFYEYEHIPGIDWLGRNTHSVGELSPKQVSSAATQLGKKQVITETFACCGWDATPLDMKRIAGFQYANGVNMFCHHLIPYSERGSRKYDYPAHYSDINPWVKDSFKEFNDYFTRLGYLLGEGTTHVKVAMLHPIRSTYFDYKRELEAEGFGIAQHDRQIKEACRTLSSQGIEYHFLDETLLAKYGFVNDANIGCGKCEYEYLVLPNIVTMDRTTEALLHQYVQNGGKVLILGEKPRYLEADEYGYEYLKSTCTLDDIAKAQVYQAEGENTSIYSTYRTMGEEQFLYVINVSETETYEQTFNFGENVRSFEKVDLLTGERKQVPLTITLKPGEDAILYTSDKEMKPLPEPKKTILYFKDSKIRVKDNYLPVDFVSYSTDGINYSEPWPYEALFYKLLQDRYQGKIYFKYEFDVKAIPTRIFLKAETDGRDTNAWLNGDPLVKGMESEEFYIRQYDVSSLVRNGRNEYIVEVDWYQDELVYHALFGENITESLLNCLKYDSELQAIYLEGEFGVYSDESYQEDEVHGYIWGNRFYIGEMAETVTDFVTDGFPFVAGEIILETTMNFEDKNIILEIPGEYQMMEVCVNDITMGKCLYEKEVDISKVVVIGENKIQVRFWISNRNLMGPRHYTGVADTLVKWHFELTGTWEEDSSPYYRKDYVLKKFYTK